MKKPKRINTGVKISTFEMYESLNRQNNYVPN